MYFEHVTLTTGHVAIQPYDPAISRSVAMMADIITDALHRRCPRIPGIGDDYHLTAGAEGYNLSVTLCAGPLDTPEPILTTGVALKSRSAPRLWRLLHARSPIPLATTAALPPPAPWIADRIEAGAANHTDVLRYTGGMSRVIGWTWAHIKGIRHHDLHDPRD